MNKYLVLLSLTAFLGLSLVSCDDNVSGPIEEILSESQIEKLENTYSGGGEEFFEGRCKVYKDGKGGFINSKGKEVITCQFDYVHDFSEGMAAFEKNGKWGFIDRKGNEIIPAKYNKVDDFSEGMAAFQKEEYGNWGFIDKKGNEIVADKYNDVSAFKQGLAVVAVIEEYDGWFDSKLYGYINDKGEEVIKPQYTKAQDFSVDGLAAITTKDKKSNHSYINTKGEIVLSGYDANGDFSEGFAWVKKNNKKMVINTKGDEVFTINDKMYFEYKAKFCDGLIPVVKVVDTKRVKKEVWGRTYETDEDIEKYGYLNTKGETAIEFNFDDAENFSNGKAKVEEDGSRFYINTKGEKIQK